MARKEINIKKKSSSPKVVVILGPTGSGKTALGVKLAAKFNGEIISADSRQVYRGMDIGTGKDLAEYKIGRKKIPYHLIDIINPNTKFNLARYQKLAVKEINNILGRGHLPMIVGGTGLYLQAVIDNYQLAAVKSDTKQRDLLEQEGAPALFAKLSILKPDFAAKINNSDKNNARRLARYLEIATSKESPETGKRKSPFEFLVLGIDVDDAQMRAKITRRLDKRLEEEGMVKEVERLHEEGVSYKRLISFGLEYKFISHFLQGKLSETEMRDKLLTAIYRFAKKQKTWFRRFAKQGREIEWVQTEAEVQEKITQFLK